MTAVDIHEKKNRERPFRNIWAIVSYYIWENTGQSWVYCFQAQTGNSHIIFIFSRSDAAHKSVSIPSMCWTTKTTSSVRRKLYPESVSDVCYYHGNPATVFLFLCRVAQVVAVTSYFISLLFLTSMLLWCKKVFKVHKSKNSTLPYFKYLFCDIRLGLVTIDNNRLNCTWDMWFKACVSGLIKPHG